ncbi:hypothetical protein BDR03DRAFT_955082, partial [Suillus americanus]
MSYKMRLLPQTRRVLERCICDCVLACREQGKVVKNTTLRQTPKDTQWLAKLRCYSAATRLLPLLQCPQFLSAL